jgi:hypothetical protein
MRIRDVYPGSRIRIFPSRISDPGSRVKKIPELNNYSILILKIVPKLSEI